jgi:enoyl-CoA hydratase
MREDRASSYAQWGLDLGDALRTEYDHGMRVVSDPDMLAGVARFTGGAGRHGQPA